MGNVRDQGRKIRILESAYRVADAFARAILVAVLTALTVVIGLLGAQLGAVCGAVACALVGVLLVVTTVFLCVLSIGALEPFPDPQQLEAMWAWGWAAGGWVGAFLPPMIFLWTLFLLLNREDYP